MIDDEKDIPPLSSERNVYREYTSELLENWLWEFIKWHNQD